jgi:hypothetical protein
LLKQINHSLITEIMLKAGKSTYSKIDLRMAFCVVFVLFSLKTPLWSVNAVSAWGHIISSFSHMLGAVSPLCCRIGLVYHHNNT